MLYSGIIQGGVATKNSPHYTPESFILANKNQKVKGIIIDAYLTKNNELILVDQDSLTKMGLTPKNVNQISTAKLKNFNSGTKVKRNFLITLNELLLSRTHCKIIIVNIITLPGQEQNIMNYLQFIMKKHTIKNVFLVSESLSMTEKLLQLQPQFKIGTIVHDDNDFNYSFDFYIAEQQQCLRLGKLKLKEKLDSGCLFFLTPSKEKKDLSALQILDKKVFMIYRSYHNIFRL